MMTNDEIQKRIDAFYSVRKPDPCIERCKKITDIRELIVAAASAKCSDDNEKIHRHQNRQGTKLLAFRDALLKKTTEIDNCKTFEELLDVVGSVGYRIREVSDGIVGIGILTVYDTADRIGTAKGMEPDAIYMHAGTKKGAEAVLCRKIKEWKIDNEKDLPEPFHNLPNRDIESMLCTHFAP